MEDLIAKALAWCVIIYFIVSGIFMPLIAYSAGKNGFIETISRLIK